MTKQTITEQIKSAEKYLGVNHDKLMHEIIGFYESEDSKAMIKLFNAYKDWQLKGRDGSRSVNETIQLAKMNLDTIARVADYYHIEKKDIFSAISYAVKLPESTSGPVSSFYRTAINYQPSDPNMN